MKNKSVTIRAAWIGVLGAILAAILIGTFTLIKSKNESNKSSNIKIENAENSPLTNQVGNQTINYNFKDSIAKKEIIKNVIKNDSSPNSVNVQGDKNTINYSN